MRSTTILALAVGFWTLAGQFIVNRIIFFYVANSEYAAASIIALHLTGFWLGATLSRRYMPALSSLLAATFGLTAIAELLTWRFGVIVLGLPATVATAALFGVGLAGLSGAIVVRLMHDTAPHRTQKVLIADTAGSVAGAVAGGFWLLPTLGIQASFLVVLGVQAIMWLTSTLKLPRFRRAMAPAVTISLVLLGLWTLPVATSITPRVLAVEGMPVEAKQGRSDQILYSERSPFGLVSVIQSGENRQLNIDGRPLCITGSQWSNPLAVDPSAWAAGEWPARRAGQQHGARFANIGLGCGMTMAAMLENAMPDAALDVIEINPVIAEAQRLYDSILPHSQDDPRINLLIRDGFRHFAEYGGTPYDAVAIDVAWMQNMNATHLFSLEMYQNIRQHLKPEGILGVWIEESTPFSPTSVIIFRTLKQVFPNVVTDVTKGAVVMYASPSRTDLVNDLDALSATATDWLKDASALAPVNKLDDLAINRTKFVIWGDSTWERLRDKYAAIRRAAWTDE
ncbi:MAG: hypothetical protein AB7U75_07205 [Hyphomicrobiaceae bacterium]